MNYPGELRAAAHRAMLANGFVPDFPPDVLAEANNATDPAQNARLGNDGVRNLRQLAWSSIDNDSSVDLDQLEVAERLDNGDIRLRVAIADVSGTVTMHSATDRHAAHNSTSVYTGIAVFPMLPERLSTELTSLGQGNDRPAIVIECSISANGEVGAHDVYTAFVHNHAKLAYGNVGAWLDGKATLSQSATAEVQAQLHLQNEAATRLRADRVRRGALSFETIEAQSVLRSDGSVDIELVQKTRASFLIEDFMVTANVVMAQFLDERKTPSIRRVVRTPERWNRIVALAAEVGETLPAEPNAQALGAFLAKRREADAAHFADLSLSIVKLLGPGQYEVHSPGDTDEGHFGLATHYYTHSTAPNRRYVDLVTQRLLKAVLRGEPSPYSVAELAEIAQHCTERENAARKVERLVRKEAAAASMAGRTGELFDAVVTGVTSSGTFVRVLHPPVEGRVVEGEAGMDVGEKVRVRLQGTDVAKGFIDFVGVGNVALAPASLPHTGVPSHL